MQLEFSGSSREVFRGREVRRALALVIQETMPDFYYLGLVPVPQRLSVQDFQLSGADRLDEARSVLRGKLTELCGATVGYYDYYPNRTVARHVANCWKELLGFSCNLVRIPFDRRRKISTDIRLELRFPKYDHVISRNEAALAYLQSNSPFEELTAKVRQALAVVVTSNEPITSSIEEFEKRLAESYAVIPLYDMQSIYLMSKTIKGFQYPHNAVFSYDGLRKQ